MQKILQINPIMTRPCSRENCDEIIYRDTIDKTDGFQIAGNCDDWFCSELCARIVLQMMETRKLIAELKDVQASLGAPNDQTKFAHAKLERIIYELVFGND